MIRIGIGCVLLCASLAPMAAAQDAPPRSGLDVADVARWPLDTITLRNGKTLSGLIRHQDNQQIELVEVGRRPGQLMYLLVRPLATADVAKVERLDDADRKTLEKRLDAFRSRVAILAAMIDNVPLRQVEAGGKKSWHYDGPWFALDSTADERVTREAIVRIEQTFAAYRTLLRPRREAPRPLRVVLVGSVKEFRELLAASGLQIGSSAFFDPRQNLIVAGGDLAAVAKRMEEVHAHHVALSKEISAGDARAKEAAQELAQALKSQGASAEKRRQVIVAARKQWQGQRRNLLRDIRIAEQQNAEMYYRQFARLYHEAFHAYLDNYVLDAQDYDVPRWLNEGWAQIFEAGLLDVNTLRIDAPRSDLLSALAEDLRGPSPPRLAELLTTPPADYVAGHREAAANVGRLYRASWGLAWYLTFERQLLGTPELEAFLRRDPASSDPVKRFEKLVGQPLPEFEAQWRAKMLELK